MHSNKINPLIKFAAIGMRALFILIIFICIGLLFLIFTKFAYPFIIAFVLSFLLNPMVSFFERKVRCPRGLATLMVLIIMFGVMTCLIILLAFQVMSGLTYLNHMLPLHIKLLIQSIQDLFFLHILPIWERTTHYYQALSQSQQLAIEHNIQLISQKSAITIADIGSKLINGLGHFIISLPSILATAIIIFLATFFISKDWNRFARYVHVITTPKIDHHIIKIYAELKDALVGFIRAQCILISITAVIVFIGLFALHVEHAFSISLMIGLIDLIPYLGTSFIFIPWILYCFLMGNYSLSIGLCLLFAIVIIQRQLMEPKVISDAIGIDPLATLISLFIGFQLFGFLGLILGPVTVVIVKALITTHVVRDIWNYIIGYQDDPYK
ncbi:sporulation integral membrane protein YtvI [Terrilactibacillus sp. BCM23-1]|uniref:Sporulation integral membrane protein YtvI n=1 Tax=Terrilactibacillus tamarindi TaxID=2599694 RepID=A0A6N8CPT6_9BACI|nr:sporulation integral membrane protein YtvI [Terrilactibacillus tamarindi]MTT31668.1 sporulation integral membrane protein YtvI [Terrilactibacillus tamarindi]